MIFYEKIYESKTYIIIYIIDALSKLIREAGKNLKQVKIGSHSILLENMNRNRRGDPDVDNELTITRIDYENGGPMTALINWAWVGSL